MQHRVDLICELCEGRAILKLFNTHLGKKPEHVDFDSVRRVSWELRPNVIN